VKNLLYLIVLCLLLTSCNSTKSGIITSKSEAIKKNKYDTSITKITVKKVRANRDSQPVIKKKETKINDTNADDIQLDDSNYLINQLIETASENIGVRYKMGGTSKNGFDCSGLMYTTFNKYGIELPRTSSEMSQTGKTINKENAQKGDLIFFVTNGRSISHVGMIVEVSENEIKFIHASTSSGVMISSLNEAYYRNAFAKIKRVLE
jgi:cell wall-associated NlpC family hydrolase